MADSAPRYLLVTADDYGIGVETSRGILDLAVAGAITSTVLLVTSPHAAESVALWRKLGRPVELGWHPCLTLDAPVLPSGQVPTLVDSAGQFLPLGRFLRRLARGAVDPAQLLAEFRAQYRRFTDLVGGHPANVNAHHHLHVFRPVGEALARTLLDQWPRPYLRRVVEPWQTLLRVRGARFKRIMLSRYGGRAVRRQQLAYLPGNEYLIGITDPPYVHSPGFFARWLRHTPGRFVELTCHPGRLDGSLAGRDGTFADGHLHRRPAELNQLRCKEFRSAVAAAGFTLVNAEEMIQLARGVSVRKSVAA